MSAACGHHHDDLPTDSRPFRRALWAVIAINATMFAVEVAAGAAAGSRALLADSLDFLGDSATYAVSLLVLGAALAIRARVALFKGISMAALGLAVGLMTALSVLGGATPEAPVMGVVGALALLANLASVLLLLRFRDGDANLRSVWLCSRNDAIGNVLVILAAWVVAMTDSRWPDLVVAGIMTTLFLWGAAQVIRQARQELAHARHGHAAQA
ncbi:MAG: cation transporter [Pseudomonadota bacterium]|nr:cation transporter [Pseudomonadota bacterium]